MATSIVMPSEQTAISELRTLRKQAEKSAKEIGKALLKWQKSLGHGKFKQAYMAAGWPESSVYYYIKQAQPPTPKLETQEVENKKHNQSQEREEEEEGQTLEEVCAEAREESALEFLTLLSYEAVQQAVEIAKQKAGKEDSHRLDVLWSSFKKYFTHKGDSL